MKIISFKYLVAAVLVVAAGAAVAGFPFIPPEALASVGMLGMVGHIDLGEIKQLLTDQSRAWHEFKTKNDNRLGVLETEFSGFAVEFLRAKALGPGNGTASKASQSLPAWYDVKTKQPIRVIGPNDSLLDAKAGAVPSVGRFLRGLVTGGNAPDAAELTDERKALSIDRDPAGGYTVGGDLASRWIDLLRRKMVLNRAGVTTVPMDSQTLAIAKLTGDPVCSWHKENAALADSDPTFGAVTLTSRTVVALVKLSIELAQDASNIEEMLQSTLTTAMANAIDAAGLMGVTQNAGAAPIGIFNAAGRNKVQAIGAPTSWDFLADGMYELMLDNVPEENIGSVIAHPALWRKMTKLRTGLTNDNSPLPVPETLARVPKLWTTAAPFTGGNTCDAIIGNWGDLLFGVRKDISVRVLTEAFFGSNLQVAVVAYARVDFVPAREQSFCTLEGITVA